MIIEKIQREKMSVAKDPGKRAESNDTPSVSATPRQLPLKGAPSLAHPSRGGCHAVTGGVRAALMLSFLLPAPCVRGGATHSAKG